jgi:calcineurin-like phosphoesterase family protein
MYLNRDSIKHIFTLEDKIFFTSDTHFGHENILKYCHRPFINITEHDEELIRRWNEVVPPDGIVFHLGDIAFCSEVYLKEILKRLNGKIYWILGNHDWRRITPGIMNRFEHITQQMMIKIDGENIYLNHFPFLCYPDSKRHTVYQFFGHVHSGPLSQDGSDISRLVNLMPNQYDVGVDNNNFTPVSFQEIKQKIGQKN